MLSLRVLLSFVHLGLVCATSLANFVVHEKVEVAPQGFTPLGPAPAEQTVNLRIALAQANKSAVVDALYSVSDPTSAKYGQHLSIAEVCTHCE